MSDTKILRRFIDFADLNTAVELGRTVPGDIVIDGGVYVITAFNGTTPVLEVGFAGDNQGGAVDDNALATALTLAAVGQIKFDELTATTNKRCTVADKITATFKVSSGTPSAGRAVVWVEVLNTHPLNDKS